MTAGASELLSWSGAQERVSEAQAKASSESFADAGHVFLMAVGRRPRPIYLIYDFCISSIFHFNGDNHLHK